MRFGWVFFQKFKVCLQTFLSPNSLGKKQNLRLQRNILIYCHKTTAFREYILKIYSSTYVKAAFREKVHPLKQKFKICLQPHLSLSSRGKTKN
jgi:hypothetical protein